MLMPLLPVPAPAGGARGARPRGRMAAVRVLGQRCAPLRNEQARHSPLGWGHNSRGADRFRLGTLVPGEAGREGSVISLTIAAKP